MRDFLRSTFAHQDEERFIPLSAGNGELMLLTYLRGPKELTYLFELIRLLQNALLIY